MGQRIVLRLTEWTMTAKALREFCDKMDELGIGPRTKIYYAVDGNGVPCFYAELPQSASAALTKAATPPRPTKAQQAVRGQLQARAEAVKAKQPLPGHVPAVARGGRVLKTRKKKT